MTILSDFIFVRHSADAYHVHMFLLCTSFKGLRDALTRGILSCKMRILLTDISLLATQYVPITNLKKTHCEHD